MDAAAADDADDAATATANNGPAYRVRVEQSFCPRQLAAPTYAILQFVTLDEFGTVV